ncbi:hypothetical protein ACFO8Q_08445 [Effusibacillus consociatus]|uniref:Bacterial bifunctional deaminase-reductase C-terminal domain-containing protein n=1 Tax=Effusibacillus consociatus TaxID=1117041 RepID=A0ABV9PZN2_9BACL
MATMLHWYHPARGQAPETFGGIALMPFELKRANLLSHLTFDSLIVESGNRFAYAAARDRK